MGLPFCHKGLLLMTISILLFLNSCSVSLFQGLRPADDVVTSPVSWFKSDTAHFLFNTKIDVLKNHFSGLMVIKQVGADNYRVVFITEVGLKIFDMEFFPDRETKVHYIMDAMNKKALVRTLSNDISLMLMNRYSGKTPAVLHERDSREVVFEYSDQGRKNYYHLAGTAVHPYRVRQSSGITNKVRAELYGTEKTGIDSIKITHYNFKLSINLFRIIEETNHVAE